ncbi:MAG: nucleotidyl transferase AbiEii/AbiGii toxin family protein [Elusimicrobia bacterium]|jgi:hypothetical protein|nr:nucleotidyl transferase AbiEii/AbiGii toxin family protein [Elusimicrobiota bacterium]
MIGLDTLNLEWIKKVSAENQGADKILIEKVIRALLLLEGLSQSKLPFVFKGGTAVMLILGTPKRFSIDIDIISSKKSDLEDVFMKIVKEKGFTKYELQSREPDIGIDKIHYRFFYSPVHQTNISEDNILLDILVETAKYKRIEEINVASPFVKQTEVPLQVRVPSSEDIVADKMTAFAPNTTGIPYEKGGYSRTMGIIKQLYDIGNLFDKIEDLSIVDETFNKIAETEMKYRKIDGSSAIVLNDMIQTALCLSTKGAIGIGDFSALQNGISQIKAYIYSENYHIEKVIVHAARVAYLAKLVELKKKFIVRFEQPEQITDWIIEDTSINKLNKLKKSNPEAFFYWYQAYLIGKNAQTDNSSIGES